MKKSPCGGQAGEKPLAKNGGIEKEEYCTEADRSTP